MLLPHPIPFQPVETTTAWLILLQKTNNKCAFCYLINVPDLFPEEERQYYKLSGSLFPTDLGLNQIKPDC